MNLLHFSHNKKAQGFVNLLFWFSIISTTNKPTRVNIDFITAIGHIITNSILDCDFKIGKSGKWTDLAHSIKIFKQFLLLTRKQKCLKNFYIFSMKKEIMAHFTKKLIVLYSPKKEILAHFMKKSNLFYVLSK